MAEKVTPHPAADGGPEERASARIRRVWRWSLLFLSIGLIAGMGAIAFDFLTQLGLRVFLDGMAGYRPLPAPGEQHLFTPSTTVFNRWILLALPALGGLLSGWLVFRYAPEAEGHGTDAAIQAYHVKGGFIRGRVPLVKMIASAVTLTTGGSGGREGPIAQIGAGFGSFLATRLGLSARERRIMMAAGIGAGVGSIFRAPLAGAMFAAEVLIMELTFVSAGHRKDKTHKFGHMHLDDVIERRLWHAPVPSFALAGPRVAAPPPSGYNDALTTGGILSSRQGGACGTM